MAGVSALILSAHPDWSPAQVLEALRRTASHAGQPVSDNDLDASYEGSLVLNRLHGGTLSLAVAGRGVECCADERRRFPLRRFRQFSFL